MMSETISIVKLRTGGIVIYGNQHLFVLGHSFSKGPLVSMPQAVDGCKWVLACSSLGSFLRTSYDVGRAAIITNFM